MHRIILLLALSSVIQSSLFGQMWNGQDSIYGNEWLTEGADYYRIDVAQDGIYRVPISVLQSAGLSGSTQGSALRLFAYGEELPIYVSTNGVLSGGDYVEFYGEKNKAQLDRHFYKNYEEDMLSPEYSTINDSVGYFLTVSDAGLGKRYIDTPNDLNNAGSPLDYFMHSVLVETATNGHSYFNRDGVRYSHHDPGEGFGSAYNKTKSYDIEAPSVSLSGPNASIDIRLVSQENRNSSAIPDNNTHNLTIDWNSNNLTDSIFTGFRFLKINYALSVGDIAATNTIAVNGLNNANDKYGIGHLALTYPRIFDFGGASAFEFNVADGAKHLINIAAFNDAGSNPILYDVTNQLRIETSTSNDQVQLALPAGNNNRRLVLTNNSDGIISVASVKKLGISKYENSTADYIILTSEKFNTSTGGTNYVQSYANYRASVAGGSYDPQIVNVEDLYEAFGYGIERHPLAIRNFANYIYKNWENAEMIFIIGKGRIYPDIRTSGQLSNAANATFSVPTFGNPGSDNLLVGRPNSDISVLPVGRLAVSSSADINTYLNKVKSQEANLNGAQTIAEKAWMKRILHLAGGGTDIGSQISGYLRTMESIITNNSFGAEVKTFSKTSTDPVQISQSEQIFEVINSGLTLISFFGHSSPGTFDFNIDNPENFENAGRMPVLISLGCFSGNIHTGAIGISERFVLYENKGSIAFIASTGPGYTNTLSQFGQEFYKVGGEDLYGAPLGKILQQSIIDKDLAPSLGLQSFVQQVSLNGDPALRLNPRPGADYTINPTNINFSPEVIDTRMDQYELSFEIVNLGRVTADSIEYEVHQEYPNGQRNLIHLGKVPSVANKRMIDVTIPGQEEISGGLNKFFITLDPKNLIQELPSPGAESNNEIRTSSGKNFVELFIYDGSATPITPCQFAIHNTDDLSLKAYSGFIPNTNRSFVFEIDTTPNFNSPALEKGEILSPGGLLEWVPSNYSSLDGNVFFWRVSPNITASEPDYAWKQSSFLFDTGSQKGWSQASYYQQLENQYVNIEFGEDRKLKFLDDFLDVRIINKIMDPSDYPEFQFQGNNFTEMFWNFPHATIRLCIVGPIGNYWTTATPQVPTLMDFPFGPVSYAFTWQMDTQERRADFMNFLQNVIPDDYTVFLYTALKDTGAGADLHIEDWANDSIALGQNLFSVMEDLGAEQFRSLQTTGSRPYTFVFKKGSGKLKEDIGDSLLDKIFTEHPVAGLWNNGSMKSTFVGPAKSWKDFEFELEDFDNFVNDSMFFRIVGSVDGMMGSTILADSITENLDISFINPIEYPYLSIEFFTKDLVDKTPPNIKTSKITYEGISELTVNPSELFVLNRDSLDQGEELQFSLALKNIGEHTQDSISVSLKLKDDQNQELSVNQKIPPLDFDESYQADFNVSTAQILGRNNIQFEMNGDNAILEKTKSNNFLTSQTFIRGDRFNPLLDVTFDGVKIMEGDIVSAQPEIVISLNDENQYFPLNDTAGFKVFISDPEGIQNIINFSDPDIEFIPSTGADKNALVILNKRFELDGTYRLLIQAEDRSGNASGQNDYAVNFKIVNEKMISNVLNYPNPFSTSTQFVYTLTGDQAPDFFKIQIFTVSGKIVRELTQHDLGPLKVGTHRTDYAWDGTDEFGDRLGNGVYLYQVVTNEVGGTQYKEFTNGGIDTYFTEGFGKMVIVR